VGLNFKLCILGRAFPRVQAKIHRISWVAYEAPAAGQHHIAGE